MLITQMKQWIEEAWWTWVNGIVLRFDYNDRLDECAFWEDINLGWYQMYIYPYDDWYNPTISDERKLRLGEKPTTIYVSEKDYDSLLDAINQPPKPSQGLIDLMNRTPPWGDTNGNV